MTYRLIALDLDGTLIDHDLVILPAVQAAIAAAQARGVHISLATGRMYAATLPFARQLAVRAPLICYQGALIRDPVTAETLSSALMPPVAAAGVVRALLAKDIFTIAYIDERLHISAAGRTEFDYYLSLHPESAVVVVEPDLTATVRARQPTKLLFVAEPAVVTAALDRLVAEVAGQLVVTRSHRYFGEVVAPGVNKGIALARLASHLGVPRELVIAIGDQENDLPMIRWAGLGLAIGNAVAAVREAAAAVLPTVREAGVAWAIERYILNAESLAAVAE